MIDTAVAVLGLALTCSLFCLLQNDSRAYYMVTLDVGVFTVAVAGHGLISHVLSW
jgi:hypothetical protein